MQVFAHKLTAILGRVSGWLTMEGSNSHIPDCINPFEISGKFRLVALDSRLGDFLACKPRDWEARRHRFSAAAGGDVLSNNNAPRSFAPAHQINDHDQLTRARLLRPFPSCFCERDRTLGGLDRLGVRGGAFTDATGDTLRDTSQTEKVIG